MDDFEYAVESQTLPSFLKQDQDHGSTSNTSATEGAGTIGENELDRLMREMSEADIDAFAAELGVGVGKVGLMVPEGSEPLDGGKELETIGVKGTGEVVENPDLELEKKMASVEIGGKVEPEGKEESDKGTSGVVETLKKVEEAVVGADDGVAAGKEKID
jgi:hypothetical protein